MGFHCGLRISGRWDPWIYFIFNIDHFMYFEIYSLLLECNFFEDWDHCNQISTVHYWINYFCSSDHFHYITRRSGCHSNSNKLKMTIEDDRWILGFLWSIHSISDSYSHKLHLIWVLQSISLTLGFLVLPGRGSSDCLKV